MGPKAALIDVILPYQKQLKVKYHSTIYTYIYTHIHIHNTHRLIEGVKH